MDTDNVPSISNAYEPSSQTTPQPTKKRRHEELEENDEPGHFRRVRLRVWSHSRNFTSLPIPWKCSQCGMVDHVYYQSWRYVHQKCRMCHCRIAFPPYEREITGSCGPPNAQRIRSEHKFRSLEREQTNQSKSGHGNQYAWGQWDNCNQGTAILNGAWASSQHGQPAKNSDETNFHEDNETGAISQSQSTAHNKNSTQSDSHDSMHGWMRATSRPWTRAVNQDGSGWSEECRGSSVAEPNFPQSGYPLHRSRDIHSLHLTHEDGIESSFARSLDFAAWLFDEPPYGGYQGNPVSGGDIASTLL